MQWPIMCGDAYWSVVKYTDNYTWGSFGHHLYAMHRMRRCPHQVKRRVPRRGEQSMWGRLEVLELKLVAWLPAIPYQVHNILYQT